MFSINAHRHWVNSARFSPDTRLIATGSEDRTVKLWDITSKHEINTFNECEMGITDVQFHPDGTCISAGSEDRSIKIWDIRSKKQI